MLIHSGLITQCNMTTEIRVNIVSGNGFLTHGAHPLDETMDTYSQLVT